ncbi:uncharacterized protein PGTG_20164, partial [Puccinia graminis f. sp. tritici CRL 75-36-700-3]
TNPKLRDLTTNKPSHLPYLLTLRAQPLQVSSIEADKDAYSIDGPNNVQEFSVARGELQLYSKVLLKIISNHGNPDLTCLYRVQVHDQLIHVDVTQDAMITAIIVVLNLISLGASGPLPTDKPLGPRSFSSTHISP